MLSETAINIGYSCKLLTDEMEEIYVIDGETYEEVLEQMNEAKVGMIGQASPVMTEGAEQVPLEGRMGMLDIKLSQMNADREFGGFALVVNGHSLVSGFFFFTFLFFIFGRFITEF